MHLTTKSSVYAALYTRNRKLRLRTEAIAGTLTFTNQNQTIAHGAERVICIARSIFYAQCAVLIFRDEGRRTAAVEIERSHCAVTLHQNCKIAQIHAVGIPVLSAVCDRKNGKKKGLRAEQIGAQPFLHLLF